MKSLGYHAIYDLRGDFVTPYPLVDYMIESAKLAGLSVESCQSKQFQPQGATVLLLLSESHASIHTWPEHGFATLDIFCCSPDAERKIKTFVSLLAAQLCQGRPSNVMVEYCVAFIPRVVVN